jgi:hypothetical protein
MTSMTGFRIERLDKYAIRQAPVVGILADQAFGEGVRYL